MWMSVSWTQTSVWAGTVRTPRDPSSVTASWDTLYAREPQAAQVSETNTHVSPQQNVLSAEERGWEWKGGESVSGLLLLIKWWRRHVCVWASGLVERVRSESKVEERGEKWGAALANQEPLGHYSPSFKSSCLTWWETRLQTHTHMHEQQRQQEQWDHYLLSDACITLHLCLFLCCSFIKVT